MWAPNFDKPASSQILKLDDPVFPPFSPVFPNEFFAQGYSGHGISIATVAGKLISEAVVGTAERFDVMAKLPTHIFPGGTLLRYPGMVLGMLYFSLKDKL